MAKISPFQFAALFHALQTDGPLPENIEALRFEVHEDYEQLGSLGVLLHKTERWPYLLTQLRKRIPALEAYCRATQFIYSGTEAYALIERTVRQAALGESNVRTFVDGLVADTHPPGYAGVWLQAVCQFGLSDDDVKLLALAIRNSGEVHDHRIDERLGGRRLVRYDLLGGLSDKVGLILPALLVALCRDVPIALSLVAACHQTCAGGLWGQWATIPGFRFLTPSAEVFDILRRYAATVVTADLKFCPAGEKFGRLFESIGASMSPDLVSAHVAGMHLSIPPHSMVLDIQVGGGGPFNRFFEARAVAGRIMGMLLDEGVSVVSDYSAATEPSGVCIGPILEVSEAIALMKGVHSALPLSDAALQEQKRLTIGVFEKLVESELGPGNWRQMATRAFEEGLVLEGFREFLNAHEVRLDTADRLVGDPVRFFGLAKHSIVPARKSGRLMAPDIFKLRAAAKHLADMNGGVVLKKRMGESVATGEPIAEIWTEKNKASGYLADQLLEAFTIKDDISK